MSAAIFDRLAKAADNFATRSAFEAAVAVTAAARYLDRQVLLAGADPNDVRYDKDEARAVNEARHQTFYLLSTFYGLPLRKIARLFGVSHEAVRKAVAAVEDAREDPRTDRALDEIELVLMGDVVTMPEAA